MVLPCHQQYFGKFDRRKPRLTVLPISHRHPPWGAELRAEAQS